MASGFPPPPRLRRDLAVARSAKAGSRKIFPLPARSHQALSVAYERKNDRESGMKSLQRAIELDPNNAQYKQELVRLQKPPATP